MPTIELAYEPREQFVEFHQRSQRWSSLVCHRRAGKTVACVNDLVARATYTQKHNPRYAYIAPFQRQARDVAWQYLKDATANGLAKKVRESQLRVELFNDSWITLYGADNPNALRGLYLDGVILDEYGDCRPSLWNEVILPTLTDRQGWGVFIGTPKGHNHFYEIHQLAKGDPATWYNMVLKASESGIIPASELEEIKKQYAGNPEKYEQEFECSFEAAIQGAYYGDLMEQLQRDGHFCEVPHHAGHPVFVATDLGYTDSTAMWFWQVTSDGINVIDYFEDNTKPLSYYMDYLDYLPYEYQRIYLPHDSKAANLQTGRSTIEQFVDRFGTQTVQVLPKLAVQDGIEAARMMMPTMFFDYEKCKVGIEALKAYQRSYNEITQAFSNTPLHNWASHGADAFRYLALAVRQELPAPTGKRHKEVEFPTKPVEWTLDELWKDYDENRADGDILRIA